MENQNQIEIYKADDGSTQINVQFEQETVWLTQAQMATLFETTPQNITMHLKSIFKEQELNEKATCKEFLQVRKEGTRTVKRKQLNYNLDAIISVGYRIKSTRATQFRIWATSILKDYLVKGYAINEKRLAQKEQEVQVLKNGIQILSRVIEEKTAENEWLTVFANGLSLLDDYDHEELDTKGLTTKEANYPSLADYQKLINQMLTEFDSDVFGKEKDKSFESSIAQIEKGFGTKDFYPTIEEKAAMLLYLVVKNHSFVDGNKRIAAACFLKFLQQNNLLFNSQNQPIISNDTLASLTLFIASSKPEEMETVKRLVISVLNRNKTN
ncbi:virulence protein RhuM/Fic/DOC family protein [Lutibacter sp. A80]|uniref:virulence protein RhuM/Fic/DOC family protein n=1 Tax=Lutibacter sp. A80 TaxID=2918453 RepID=UPI001F06AAE9|nr:virulence protein RhuM/Fic/DOC family protein [Lutibacter sp. A80]UMB61035.1 virulence protein RhuM/Fic/DOC family protein [Lutibacter sp. A80]